MTDDLSVAIERLRTSTQRLNDITDAAARVVKDVETLLEEARVGVSAHVFVKETHEPGEAIKHLYLEYCRINNGKFRISVTTNDNEGLEMFDCRPWAESSRDE